MVGIWRGWLGSEVWFPGPKFWENAQNGSSQKRHQIGRSYFLGRDMAVFIFWGLKRKVLGLQLSLKLDAPRVLFSYGVQPPRLYFLFSFDYLYLSVIRIYMPA